MNPQLTLAIDTSCDETSVSVVRGLTVLSNLLPSQMEYHSKFGGVVPSLAKLAHTERIDNVVNQALKKAQVEFDQLDFIAVTYGPGLAIALEVGIRKAKEIARKYKKPLMIINHMEGHMLSGFALTKSKKSIDLNKVQFPSLGVLISGGHTELILVKDFGNYEKIGETLDDACGEAYDKCGRMLGLGYPAGPVITKLAKENRKNVKIEVVKKDQSTLVKCTNITSSKEYFLPIPMLNSGDLNFSYSGLKTAFRELVEESSLTELSTLKDLASTFEASALLQVKYKVLKAIKRFDIKEIWLGGGVVASPRLRSVIRESIKESRKDILLRSPYTKKLTGDNAAMIGVAANIRVSKGLGKTYTSETEMEAIDRVPTLSL